MIRAAKWPLDILPAKLIKIIEKDCKDISFIKPNSKENELISKCGFLVNKAKKEILCYRSGIFCTGFVYALYRTKSRRGWLYCS